MGMLLSLHTSEKPSLEEQLCDMQVALDNIFPDDSDNGLCLNDIYLPEELLIHILSLVPIQDFLTLRLVCKKWYNLTKTHSIWSTIFRRRNLKTPRHAPWYVCFKYLDNSLLDMNLLKNNCAQEDFKHWVLSNGRHRSIFVEPAPIGCEVPPLELPDFNNKSSCFVTSYTEGSKHQLIPLNGILTKHILRKFKPHIYVSEWYAGRFDCGGSYQLFVGLYRKRIVEDNAEEDNSEYELVFEKSIDVHFLANEATKWKKAEILIEDYPDDIDGIMFKHKAKDNQFWAGQYGPKMSGGVVKLLFDSIEEKLKKSATDEGNEED